MAIFEISRVSTRMWNAKAKPCKNATQTGFVKHDEEWSIEINTLEELIALIQEVREELIIDEHRIRIYDDYVE